MKSRKTHEWCFHNAIAQVSEKLSHFSALGVGDVITWRIKLFQSKKTKGSWVVSEGVKEIL